MISVGIIGASGFTGSELLRICASHPLFEVKVATAETHLGKQVAELYPNLALEYPSLEFTSKDSELLDECKLIFLGLPHGASQHLVPNLLDGEKIVVDLGSDFRLKDKDLYPEWYAETHLAPELLEGAAYGLPELFRSFLPEASLIASPGCYPTSSALALAPFLRGGLIEETGIIVDAASGVSGAGRNPTTSNSFCSVGENFSAYGLISHRHTPEIEQALNTGADGVVFGSSSVLFTPHLLPINRGILATCYAKLKNEFDTKNAIELLNDAYSGMPFVLVDERSPSTKSTLGSNSAHLTARVDPRTGLLIVLCAIDNLGKGASGQAVQCANIALGIEETLGLSKIGINP